VESTISRFTDDREAEPNSSFWIFYYQAKLLFGTSRNVETGFAATLGWPDLAASRFLYGILEIKTITISETWTPKYALK